MAVSIRGLVWAIFINCAGIMADGYDLAVIDLILATLGELHPEVVTPERKGLMASMLYAGVLTGMIIFGLVADVLSHKVAALLTSGLTVLGCALSASCVNTKSFCLAYQLAICRFVLGLGIGGEYPISMTLGRGKQAGNLFHEAGIALTPVLILATNQVLLNLGMLLAPAVGSVLLETGLHLDVFWRILTLCGMLPSVCVFVTRLWMPEQSPEHATEDLKSKDASVTQAWTFGLLRSVGRHWFVLLGCGLSWFMQNATCFGQSSFRSVMEESMFGAHLNSRVQLVHDAHFSLFTTLFAALGTYIGLIVGCKGSLFWVQVIGFLGFTLFVGLCSLLLGPVNGANWEVFLLFCLQTAFLAPTGAMCYLLSSLSFPPKVHATCCGIAAAAGKLGALLGTATFPIIENAYGMSILLLICCCFGLAGLLVTAILMPRHPLEHTELMECESLAHSWARPRSMVT